MARTFKAYPKRGINGGNRIPLSLFREPITILRAESVPSANDESWTRNAKKVGNWHAAYEAGEIKLIADEKQSDKELFLFVIHRDDAHEFTLQDYVIHGTDVYHVQGYLQLGGARGYIQINTRSWGKLKPGDFILTEEADVPDTEQDPPSRDNIFWDS